MRVRGVAGAEGVAMSVWHRWAWVWLGSVLVLLSLGFVLFRNGRLSTADSQVSQGVVGTQFENREVVSVQVAEQVLQVEVVTTPESIAQGLSGRSEIGSDGMLFVFSSPRQATFWMPNMQFPLDIIWIRSGVVTGIAEYVPAPDPSTPLSKLPRYPSPGTVDLVLEVPAGSAAARAIAPGSPVFFLEE